jgi:hypothetical protein
MSALNRICLFASAFALLQGLGCSSSDNGSSAGTSKSGAHVLDGGTKGMACDDTPEVDLTGTWAIFFRFSIALQSQPGGAITMCPTDQTSTSTMYLLVQITHSDTDKTQLASVRPLTCTLTLPTVTGMVGQCTPDAPNLVSTEVIGPTTLDPAMQKVVMDAVTGQLDSLSPGANLTIDPMVFTIGTTSNPDNMPRWMEAQSGCGLANDGLGRSQKCEPQCVDDCSALVDADDDGFPGVTFHTCGRTPDDVEIKVQCNPLTPSVGGTAIQGRVFLDFTTNPQINGVVKSSCEASGSFAATTVYNIIGADVYLGTKVSVAATIRSLPLYNVSPTDSKFRMIRVDGKYGAPDWKVSPDTDPQGACSVAMGHLNELQ